jgi:hypothetical protein
MTRVNAPAAHRNRELRTDKRNCAPVTAKCEWLTANGCSARRRAPRTAEEKNQADLRSTRRLVASK